MLLSMKMRVKNRGPIELNQFSSFPEDVQSHRHCKSIMDIKSTSSDCELCFLIWNGWKAIAIREYEMNNASFVSTSDSDIESVDSESNDENIEPALAKVALKPVCIRVMECDNGKGTNMWLDRSPRLYVSCGLDQKPYQSIELELYTVVKGMPEFHSSIYPQKYQSRHSGDGQASNRIGDLCGLLMSGIFSNSGSKECLELARSWLQTCFRNHTSCFRNKEILSVLPTRVLHVGDSFMNPTLQLGANRVDRWVALGYSWGDNSDFELTEKSYSRMLHGVPVDEFPATIRDAIIITRALDIKYLWVDAICIFQDSSSDWEIEAPQMSKIYSNAALTIIAAASSSTKTGIFHQRLPEPSCRLPLENGTSTRDILEDREDRSIQGTPEGIIYVRANGDINDTPDRGNCPWVTRGWTLQEDILSWRTLTYTSKQMIWRCVSSMHWESGKRRTGLFPRTHNLPDFNRYLFNISKFPLEQIKSHPNDFHHQDFVKYQTWYRLVEIYTQRELTKRSDKLFAMAGAASILQDRIEDTYCAGLWRGDLIFGLIWEHNSHVRGRNFCRALESQWKKESFTLEYPSWSWISHSSWVYFPFSLHRRQKGGKFTPLALVEDVSITYSSASIFGSLKRGELILTGSCYFTHTMNRDLNDPKNNSPLFYTFLAQYMDDDDEFQNRHQQPGAQPFAVLQIARVEDKFVRDTGNSIHQSDLAFLVLQRLKENSLGTEDSNNHYYRRVGLVQLNEYLREYSPEGKLVTDGLFGVDESIRIELNDRPWPVTTLRIL